MEAVLLETPLEIRSEFGLVNSWSQDTEKRVGGGTGVFKGNVCDWCESIVIFNFCFSIIIIDYYQQFCLRKSRSSQLHEAA